MVGVSWIYKLKKEGLVAVLERYHIDTDGVMDDLRQRLVNYAKSNPGEFPPDIVDQYLREFTEEKANQPLKENQPKTPTTERPAPLTTDIRPDYRSSEGSGVWPITTTGMSYPLPPHENETAKRLDQIRKWNCHFDGRDLQTFLERVSELRTAYRFSPEQTLQGVPEMLRGEALQWYRNVATEIQTWADFEEQAREFYIPASERRRLDRQIAEKTQKANEPIRGFVTALRTLMRRRGGYEYQRQLETIYYNMRAEFRINLPLSQIRTLNELVQRVEEYEENKKQAESERPQQSRAPRSDHVMMLNAQYNRNTHCWRCKQRGHNRFNCRNAPSKFCSFCGKDGILTSNCTCPRPGNADRAGPDHTDGRPEL